MTLSDVVTFVIPVFNEEKNLPECLERIKDVTNKVVVDNGSTDRTQEIARAAGCEILDFHWNGHFPKKRNWVLQTYKFKTPWVFFLDADERVTEEFKKELLKVLPGTKHDCFRVTLDNWFMGRMLRHGDPMCKTAILRVGKGGYERIEENSWSNLPMELHEHIKVDGTTGDISARIEHHDKRSLSNYFIKHCEYADWEAHRFLALKDWSVLTRRQKIKYRLMRNKLFPVFYFCASYFFKLGFLDGVPGFYFAISKLAYFYQIQAKVFDVEQDMMKCL